METYFNSDNMGFRKAIRSRIYVDKTGLLTELNKVIFSADNCVALSHT